MLCWFLLLSSSATSSSSSVSWLLLFHRCWFSIFTMYSNRVCVCLMVLLLFVFFSKFFVLSRFWSSNMVEVLLLLFFSHRISSLSHSQIPRIWKQSFWNFFLCKWLFVSFSDHSIRSSIQRIRSSIDSIRTSSVSSIRCFFSSFQFLLSGCAR